MTLMLARFLLLHRTLDPLPREARAIHKGVRFRLPSKCEGGRRETGRRGDGRASMDVGSVPRSAVVADLPASAGPRAYRTRGPSTVPVRRARTFPLLLLALLTLASLTASSCGSSVPDVSGRWTGVLALNYGSGYDTQLTLEQDGEDLSGTGIFVAREDGEDDIPVEVADGSRVTGEEIDLILRDASGYAGLRIDLRGPSGEERIDAEGTFRGGNGISEGGLAARLELTR